MVRIYSRRASIPAKTYRRTKKMMTEVELHLLNPILSGESLLPGYEVFRILPSQINRNPKPPGQCTTSNVKAEGDLLVDNFARFVFHRSLLWIRTILLPVSYHITIKADTLRIVGFH